VRAIGKVDLSQELPAYAGGSDKPVAYTGGSDKRFANTSRTDKRIVNASGTDIFVEPPDMQMALVASARRFGPAGVTIVLAAIFAIAGGLLYGSQRWFPATEAATETLSIAPNAAALHASGSLRKQDRTRVADNAATANTRTVNVTDAPVERSPEVMNTSGVNGVVKSQPEKRSPVEPTKSQAEKKTGVVAKPMPGAGPDSPRSAPRKEPHRVGAPSIRFPKVEFRDSPRDNGPAPSPESRLRSEISSSVAGKPASIVTGKPAPSGGGPKFFRAADGTQIVKFPDGSTQFIRPGQRSGSYR
jgi:hypothetical protein